MGLHQPMAALSSVSDASLVARCRAGDDDAWEELVRRFSRYVLAIAQQAYRLSPADAEDVFQDVFIRTYERLGDLRNDDALRPWLAQLTRRLCIDRIRAGSREAADADAIELEGTDDTLEQLNEALAVQEALAAMPDACREILDRFFRRDESYAVIGAALGLPSGTIASRISRCLAKLRSQLDGREPASGTS
jgi:RNA polymerase sigma-70 factor (ECF subfamily)